MVFSCRSFQATISRSGYGYGSGRSSAASTKLKTVVVALMPSASVSAAAIAKPGLRRSCRSPYLTSCPSAVITRS